MGIGIEAAGKMKGHEFYELIRITRIAGSNNDRQMKLGVSIRVIRNNSHHSC